MHIIFESLLMSFKFTQNCQNQSMLVKTTAYLLRDSVDESCYSVDSSLMVDVRVCRH